MRASSKGVYGSIATDSKARLERQRKTKDKKRKREQGEDTEDEEEKDKKKRVNKQTGAKGYKGATVLKAYHAFYRAPVMTLDFASLYPSIMICWNMCITSLLRKQDERKYKEGVDYFRVEIEPGRPARKAEPGIEAQEAVDPEEACFMIAEKYEGVMPRKLDKVLKARKVAKVRVPLRRAASGRSGFDSANPMRLLFLSVPMIEPPETHGEV